MLKKYIIVTILLCLSPLSSQVVLSEIMFDIENPNEFIEIYNTSVDTVELQGWGIADIKEFDLLINTGSGLKLSPLSYAVIFEGDYDIENGLYSSIFPNTALALMVDGLTIGNRLSTTDSLFLINTAGDTVDSYGWENISTPGFSLERIQLHMPSEENNWSTSLDSLGTPGRKNSVSPLDIDAAINASTTTHSPTFTTSDQTITLYVTVLNLGTSTVDGTVDVSENELLLSTTSFTGMIAGDSVSLEVELSPLYSGIHTLDIFVNVDGDMNLDNNNTQYILAVQYVERVLTINEFLYSPDPGFEEFIEFVNISEDSLDLHRWGFSDSDTSSICKFPPFKIASQKYVVVSKDSSILPFIPEDGVLLISENGFPSLNNTKDSIFLFDPTGYIIDSLHYSSNWGGNNSRSMEKFNPELESSDPSNWGTCISPEKMTPGKQNSNFFESLPLLGIISVDPNPFSPDGDGFEDELRISYNLPFSQSYLTVTIFDNIGRTARELVKNLVCSSQGILVWDGYTNKGKRARIGIYIIKIDAVEMNTQKSLEWVDTIVLAEPLR